MDMSLPHGRRDRFVFSGLHVPPCFNSQVKNFQQRENKLLCAREKIYPTVIQCAVQGYLSLNKSCANFEYKIDHETTMFFWISFLYEYRHIENILVYLESITFINIILNKNPLNIIIHLSLTLYFIAKNFKPLTLISTTSMNVEELTALFSMYKYLSALPDLRGKLG